MPLVDLNAIVSGNCWCMKKIVLHGPSISMCIEVAMLNATKYRLSVSWSLPVCRNLGIKGVLHALLVSGVPSPASLAFSSDRSSDIVAGAEGMRSGEYLTVGGPLEKDWLYSGDSEKM